MAVVLLRVSRRLRTNISSALFGFNTVSYCSNANLSSDGLAPLPLFVIAITGSFITLKQKFDIGSIHDLYMEYNFTLPSMRAQFCKQVQAYFPIDIIITPEIVEKMFKKCYLG